MMKQALCLWVITALLIGSIAVPAGAQEDPKSPLQLNDPSAGYSRIQAAAQEEEYPPGELIIVDSVLLRPLGLVAMGVGFLGSIVTLPWAASSGSVDRICSELIEKPYEYTFERPVGDVDYR